MKLGFTWHTTWKKIGIFTLRRVVSALMLAAVYLNTTALPGQCQYEGFATLPSYIPAPGYYQPGRLLIRIKPGLSQDRIDRIIHAGFPLIKKIDAPGFSMLIVGFDSPYAGADATTFVTAAIRRLQHTPLAQPNNPSIEGEAWREDLYRDSTGRTSITFDYKVNTLSWVTDAPTNIEPPNDPLRPSQSNLAAMRFVHARKVIINHRRRPDGSVRPLTPVDIDIIDTGVNPIPGELTNVVQYDCSGDSAEPTLENPVDSSATHHGTALSGIAAAVTGNGIGITGLASIGPNASTVYTRMFRVTPAGSNETYISRVIAALAFLANHSPNHDANLAALAQRALLTGKRPVLVALGNAQTHQSLHADANVQSLAESLNNQGSYVVLAAGNAGLTDDSPQQHCVRVSATDNNGLLLPNSNRGISHARAPGSNILTYAYSNQVQQVSGTSAAAATWSGAIALLLSVRPGLTAQQASEVLRSRMNTTQTPVVNLESAVRAILQ